MAEQLKIEQVRADQIKADLSLLGITIIWGASFTLMKEGIKDIPPYTYLGIRYLIGAIVLALFFYRRMKNIDKQSLKYGFIIGLALAGGGLLQIVGLQYTTASKSGFITGLAVVIVPIIMAVLERKIPNSRTLFGIILSLSGLAFLTLNGSAGINFGDILTLASSLFYAAQIITIDKYAPQFDAVVLTVVEMSTVAVMSLTLGFFFEGFRMTVTTYSIFSILFTAILCSSLAYWVQMEMQKNTTPTHAAIIFLGEPVFSAIIAAILLKETMTIAMVVGCVLILFGMVVSEFNQ